MVFKFIFALLVACYTPALFAADIGSYLEDLALNRRARPVVNLHKVSTTPAGLNPLLTATEKAADVTEVNFIEGHWANEDSEPCLLVENAGQRYCLRLGARFFYTAAAEDLLRRLGLASLPRRLVTNLQVNIPADKKILLARFLAKVPVRYDWSANFRDSAGGLKVSVAMLEPVWNWRGPWNWQTFEKQGLSKRLLLATAWMQCSLIREMRDHARVSWSGREFLLIENLHGCLGMGAAVSSPNMFRDGWVAPTPEGAKFDNPFLDPGYLRAFEAMGREDLEDFFALASKLTQEDLAAVFTGNGFPAPLARLYALKLSSRLDSLGQVLGHAPSNALKPIQFHAEPQIRDGYVSGNYENFPVDLTQSALEDLIWQLGRDALKPIDEIARQLISTMPFASLEMIQMGKFHFAPGFMFRMSRSISENPKPTGPHDLFLVRDELDLAITAGLSLDRDLRIGSAWANAGAGYRRVYVKVHPAASRKAAHESFWSIPYDNLWSTDFDTLKAGEVWAIQGGWIGMTVAGATLLRGALIRPSGYILGSYEWLDTFQVARLSDGGYILAEGYDTNWFAQIKSYWRVKTRYLRVPFAGWNWRNGDQTARSLTVGPEQLNGLDEDSRLRVQRLLTAALSDRSLDGLAKELPVLNRKSHFDTTSSFYNFYYWQGTGGKSRAQVVLDGVDGEIEVLRAHQTFKDRWTGAERGWNCESAALLKRAKPADWPMDGHMQLDCYLDLENPSDEDLKWQLGKISEGLGVAIAEREPGKGRHGREFSLHARIELPWASLAPMMTDEPTGWVKGAFDSALEKARTDTSAGGNIMEGLPRLHLLTQLSGIRAVRDPSKRALQFVRAMVQMGIQEPMMGDLLREIPEKHVTLKILDQNEITTATMDQAMEYGNAFESPLRKIYEDHFLSYENLIVNSF